MYTAEEKINNNSQFMGSTLIFSPLVVETAGTWRHQAVELVHELGRRATDITGDSRETTYLFQQLSLALQKEN